MKIQNGNVSGEATSRNGHGFHRGEDGIVLLIVQTPKRIQNRVKEAKPRRGCKLGCVLGGMEGSGNR